MKAELITSLFCSMALAAFGQTTNSIPENLYPTDDGHLFWTWHGKQVVSEKKIKEAEESAESRPSDQDPDGHWNRIPEGFQISLRLKKYIFTNGEPIIATMLMRNITNQPLSYYRPLSVAVEKDGVALKRKKQSEELMISMIPSVTIYAASTAADSSRSNKTSCCVWPILGSFPMRTIVGGRFRCNSKRQRNTTGG